MSALLHPRVFEAPVRPGRSFEGELEGREQQPHRLPHGWRPPLPERPSSRLDRGRARWSTRVREELLLDILADGLGSAARRECDTSHHHIDGGAGRVVRLDLRRNSQIAQAVRDVGISYYAKVTNFSEILFFLQRKNYSY